LVVAHATSGWLALVEMSPAAMVPDQCNIMIMDPNVSVGLLTEVGRQDK